MAHAQASSLLILAALCGALSPGLVALAKPAPDWAVEAAKTPTPSIVRDATAVVLFDEILITVDEKHRAVERERSAVRVLKPLGRNLAHCSVGYDVDEKLIDFHSWTIAPDGKQIQAKDSDFLDIGAYAGPTLQLSERIRTVNPPANDPESVVICETEKQLRPNMTEEHWQIQKAIPVVNQALELDLPPGVPFSQAWHRHTEVAPTMLGPNHPRWEIKEMHALNLANIPATPNWSALAARASMQWGDSAAEGIDNQWRAIGRWQEQLEEHRLDPNAEITAKARQLVADAPDFYAKLSRITDYIQKNNRYVAVIRGIGGWQPHFAAETFRNGYGDCKDKATLVIALLQAVGIQAHSLTVDTRRGYIDPQAPSRFSNHMIVAIEVPDGKIDPRLLALVKTAHGKTVLIFDPTDDQTPVGLIRADLQGGWGYMADGDNGQILQMPVMPPESAGMTRQGRWTLTADGSISGDITESFTGDNASSWRGLIKGTNTQELHQTIERTLQLSLPSLVFKGFEFHQAAELEKPLTLDLHLSASKYAQFSGPLVMLRPRVLGTHARDLQDVMEGKNRKYPIEMGHPGRWTDSLDFVLPDGYEVDEVPSPVDVDVEFASYHSTVTSKVGMLHYERTYTVRTVEIPAEKAADFRKLEAAIIADEKATAILKKKG